MGLIPDFHGASLSWIPVGVAAPGVGYPDSAPH